MWNGLKCYKHGGTTCIWQWPDYSRPGWTNWADGGELARQVYIMTSQWVQCTNRYND